MNSENLFTDNRSSVFTFQDFKSMAGVICILLEITRDCNMSCAYCYVTPRAYSGPELNLKEWLKIVDLLSKEFHRRMINFHFAGGELFTRPWATQIILHLLEKGHLVSLVSNGFTVPEALFTHELFKGENNLFNFQISIDGLKEAHETIRFGFEQVMGNFKRLLKSGITTVVRTTVHRQNIAGVLDFYKFLNDLGEEFQRPIDISVQPVSDYPRFRVKGLHRLKLSLEEYLTAGFNLDEYATEHLANIRGHWRFVHDVRSMLDKEGILTSHSAFFGCGGGYSLTINANGDVLSCEMDVPFLNLIGHINSKTIKEIVRYLDEKNSPIKRCFSCYLNNFCGMCRLAPLLHGYTDGFDYRDCQELMAAVVNFHKKFLTPALTYS